MEDFPTQEDLGRKHKSETFPGSNDVSMSATIGKIGLVVRRPDEKSMYGVFFEHDGAVEEVAMIGGSTREAEQVHRKAVEILRENANLDEAKQNIRKLIFDLHSGVRGDP